MIHDWVKSCKQKFCWILLSFVCGFFDAALESTSPGVMEENKQAGVSKQGL